MNRSAAILLVMALDVAAAPGTGTCNDPVRLEAGASALREAFNETSSDVRLLFVVDPICPGCLRGAAEMNRAVLAPNANEKRLRTFVVHVPVIGAKELDTRRTCKLLTHGQVTHYWDASGAFGGALANGLDLKNKKGEWVYAWDVWLLYGPDTKWTATLPPRPRKMMHQLVALSDGSAYDFFDPEEFAVQVGKALKESRTR